MYIILSYEVNQARPKVERDEAIKIIQNALNDLNYVSPFNGTVLIKCDSSDDRTRLLNNIRSYTDIYKDRLFFIITPLITNNKGFNGFLSKEFHSKITEITTNEGLAF